MGGDRIERMRMESSEWRDWKGLGWKEDVSKSVAHLKEIGDEVSGKVWLSFGADVVALKQVGEAVDTAAGGCPPAETLWVQKAGLAVGLFISSLLILLAWCMTHTDALTTLQLARDGSLFNLWWVLPKVMQGQQQVMAQVSIGEKHSKKELDHAAVPVGLVMPDGSLAALEARATQLSRSDCISDLGGAAAIVGMVVKNKGVSRGEERRTEVIREW